MAEVEREGLGGVVDRTPPPPALGRGEADALTAGGLAGLSVLAAPVGFGELTLEQIARIVRQVLDGFARFHVVRAPAVVDHAAHVYRLARPLAISAHAYRVAEWEVARQREFVDRQRRRVARDLPRALGIADPLERAEAVRALLARERRYSNARERAVSQRVAGRAEAAGIRDLSPEGAYWVLGAAHVHTPDCVALAGHALPWEVLGLVHPPLHFGCRCRLLTLAEAVALGHEPLLPRVLDVAEARQLAAHALELHPGGHPPNPPPIDDTERLPRAA